MKQYVCSICGYIYDEAASSSWEALPDGWKCPLCGADKSAFREKAEPAKPEAVSAPAKPHVEKELSAMEKWKCTVCGYIHEGPMTPDFKCPVCKQPADKFVKIEDAAPAKNL